MRHPGATYRSQNLRRSVVAGLEARLAGGADLSAVALAKAEAPPLRAVSWEGSILEGRSRNVTQMHGCTAFKTLPDRKLSLMISPLDRITAAEESRAGAKAYNCARLRQAGFRVPDGLVVLSTATAGDLAAVRESSMAGRGAGRDAVCRPLVGHRRRQRRPILRRHPPDDAECAPRRSRRGRCGLLRVGALDRGAGVSPREGHLDAMRFRWAS